VRRAALRGGLGAVVADAGGAYLWGEAMVPPPAVGLDLSKLAVGDKLDMRLVVIEDGGEQLDVDDMDVGISHLVCLTDGGSVWVAGTNEHGQLGLLAGEARTEWTRVGDLIARRVVCGPQSTFFICDDNDDRGENRTALWADLDDAGLV
jgi:alpha-tubulin suppressor-like RCC1 family protein